MTTRFEIGATYVMRTYSDGDDYASRYTVVARTAKFVTIRGDFPDNTPNPHDRRVGIRVWDGEEVCSPWGRYSMAPVLSSSRKVA